MTDHITPAEQIDCFQARIADLESRPPLTVEALDAMLEQSAVVRELRDALALAENKAEVAEQVARIISPPLDASFLNRFPNLGGR